MFDKLHEECGVVAIYGHPEASKLAYLSLYALQHRGQESAGISSSDGNVLHTTKSMGHVSDIFTNEVLKGLPGQIAIGHTRYSTAGDTVAKNAQPFSVHCNKGRIAVAHNGNITNATELRKELEDRGSIFQASSDTEVILHLVAHSREKTLPGALRDALLQLEGAFSLVFLAQDRIIVARDPYGFRPLAMGQLEVGGAQAHVFASETCAFDLLNAVYMNDVQPGEMVIVGPEGVTRERFAPEKPRSQCVFEHVYFARPDSLVFGRSVQTSRELMGVLLAREAPADADIVVPVPDSGNAAALGYSGESGLPYRQALIRNHYVGRTFIEPSQAIRDFGVKLKLNPIRSLLEGKSVILVDDSIVRGTTSRKIVRMVRQAGAREVHLRISCPPTVSPCFYGVDTPNKSELIAANNSIEEIRRFIEADSLAYLSMAGLKRAVAEDPENTGKGEYCYACYTGSYPTDFVNIDQLVRAGKKPAVSSMRILLLLLLPWAVPAQQYDLVVSNGHVMDPESGLDAVRNIGITGGKIRIVANRQLRGKQTIDAKGLVVSPGFIDLHSHGQDDENYRYKARDGVTTALEMEVGAWPVDAWYKAREGKAVVNFGATSGHIPAQMSVLHDTGTFLPRDNAVSRATTKTEARQIYEDVKQGLSQGALGIGMGIAYFPKATREEIYDLFTLSAERHAPIFVHMRNPGPIEPGVVDSLQEMLGNAVATGASVHIVHIPSMAFRQTPMALEMIDGAKKHGVDVTTECYPYTAGMTEIQSAIFDPGWQERLAISYNDLQWIATGERLTEESFKKYRQQGGLAILHHMPENVVKLALTHPGVLIASDGIMINGKGHPRAAGTYSRVLARYVREQRALSLMEALRKMTLLPAQRLNLSYIGRIRVGADADLTVFDPAHVEDKSTYDNPAQYAEGIPYVIVNGVPIVRNSQLQAGVFPGRGLRR